VILIGVFDAFMAVKSDSSGLDGIPLSFVKMLLPVVLPALYIFSPALSSLPDGSALLCYQFGKFLTLRVSPISLLPCLPKVCEVLMAGQINGHICNFGLLSPFQ
jgi:hypothetical protein